MTSKAIRLKYRKARLWKRYLSMKSQYDRGMYIRANNELRHMTRILRSDFEQNIVRNVIQKPKLFWRYAKSRLKTRQNIPTLEKSDSIQFNSIFSQHNISKHIYTKIG